MSKSRLGLGNRFEGTENKFTEMSEKEIPSNVKKKVKWKIHIININKIFVKEFQDKAFTYYTSIDKRGDYSLSGYFAICIDELEKVYIKKYGELLYPTDNDKKFFSKRGKPNQGTVAMYQHENLDRLVLTITDEYFEKFETLMNTFYYKEKSNLKSYSKSFYLYDFISQIRNIKNL